MQELDVFRDRFAARGGAQLGNDIAADVCIAGLLPHQRDAVRRVNGWPLCGRACCADECGLGKTVTALQFALTWPGKKLVLCPSYLCDNWRAEIARFVHVPGATFVVVSYEQLLSAGSGDQYGVCVCDEAHYLKNYESQRFKRASKLVHRIRRVLLLTATPHLNRPIDLFSVMHLLRPATTPSLFAFARRYCGSQAMLNGKMNTTGFLKRRAPELKAWLRDGFIVRRRKDAVLTLPPKVSRLVRIIVPDEELTQLAALEEKMEDATIAQRQALVSRAFLLTSQIKTAHAPRVMLDELKRTPTRPLLVFAHHGGMLTALQVACQQHDLPYVRIDGSTPVPKRAPLVARVQANEVRVALLSLGAAGTGYTLTAATHVFFAELYWTPAVLLQAEDRAHRIGQHLPVSVTRLVATGTCDERIVRMLARKQLQQSLLVPCDGDA